MKKSTYPLFSLGDLNAFFALFLDNVVNLVILAGILIGVFGFPTDVVYQKMIPGTALGVLVGDLIYTFMAIRLAKKTGRNDITAMPLGLDTPSTIGIAFAVLGPAFLLFQRKLGNTEDAALHAWYLGMATMLWMGGVKVITALVGKYIQKAVPAAGLLGSLAGIGLVWLAGQHFIDTMHHPIVGLISLGLILITLIAHYKLPGNIPGAAAAVAFGMIIFYIGAGFEVFGLESKVNFDLTISLPAFETRAFTSMGGETLNFLAIAIPFGFLTIIGGINVTESARLVGDDYNTRDILLTEAFATLVAGAFGGVSQTTPYIGHSAYKKMGARAGYTLATALLVGIGGSLGLIQFIVDLIPKAAIAPILIFVGLEITALAYQMTPKRHNMAVTFAIIPSVLQFGYIKMSGLYLAIVGLTKELPNKLPEVHQQVLPLVERLIPPVVHGEFPYLQAMAQGFILTAMIWGAAVAFIIDRQATRASISLLTGSVLSLFGVIHSATPTGALYLPWVLNEPNQIPYKFAIAYAVLGVFVFVLMKISKKPAKQDGAH